MNKAFDEIMQGLHEAFQYEEGKLKARSRKVTIIPVAKLSAKQIKALRLSLKLSQSAFASVLGVSKKSVEAWEAGRNIPGGPAMRMMDYLKSNPDFINHFVQTV